MLIPINICIISLASKKVTCIEFNQELAYMKEGASEVVNLVGVVLHALVDDTELVEDDGVEDEEAEYVLIVECIDNAGRLPPLEDLIGFNLSDYFLPFSAKVSVFDRPSAFEDSRR